MYRSLLVPLDGSVLSEGALPIARSLARRSGAHITIVHVRTLADMYASVETPPIGVEARADRQEAIAESYLAGIAHQLSSDEGLTVTTKVLAGTVVETLHDYVLDNDIDMIVMTTHGRGMFSRLWLGSVTDALIRSMPVPILLVRTHEPPSMPTTDPIFQHILLPLDGSTLAEAILEPAIALGTLNQSRFTLFQAILPTGFIYSAPAAVIMLEEQVLEEQCAAAQRYLDAVAQRLRKRSLVVDTHVTLETASSAIAPYAHLHGVDLIAMATHGHSGFKRLLLGSVTDKVVRSAAIPVLLASPACIHH